MTQLQAQAIAGVSLTAVCSADGSLHTAGLDRDIRVDQLGSAALGPGWSKESNADQSEMERVDGTLDYRDVGL